MHISFRYHLASLVAVFFSLVLGILVGSVLFQDDRLVQEQGYIIDDLEHKFKAMALRTESLTASLEHAMEREQLILTGWDEIRAVFIQDRLVDQDIVIVSDQALAKDARLPKLLTDSGATIKGNYTWTEPKNKLVSKLETELVPSVERLATVIVLAEDEIDASKREFISLFQEYGWSICFLHPSSATVSLQDFAADALIIDIADSLLGEIGLVVGLAQSQTGVYGRNGQISEFLSGLKFQL